MTWDNIKKMKQYGWDFGCHSLYKSKVNDMGKWSVQTDSRLFAKLVKYCVKKGCKFITMTDLMKMYS